MASLKTLWLKLLHAFGAGRPRHPHWVEPANAVTRAIGEGRPLVTMATWEEPRAPFVPAPPVSVAEPDATPEHAAAETAPKRPEVAA